MASIWESQQDIAKYNALRDKVGRIINELEVATRSAGSLENELASDYKVDNDSAKVSERANSLNRGLSETAAYLKGTIIPSIDNAIAGVRQDIYRMQEEERQREEEERRRREEAELEEV